jgi:DNA (cytosine-5)-methyltransferase 1
MKPGDRFPEALAIARAVRDEALARLQAAGTAPNPGTQEWDEFGARFVPPYDEHDFPDKWRKLIPDRPSWTVPAHLARDSYSHIHYDSVQARMISIREAARLQSFPDAFLFAGNMGDCFRQIGNAVPPLLARAVAQAVLRTLDRKITDGTGAVTAGDPRPADAVAIPPAPRC